MSTELRVKATFAGAVAALWLDYVHGLITQQQTWDWAKADRALYSELCSRIENCLTHLERSSMPLPDMTIEDVIAMGAEMQADEDFRAELEEAAKTRGETNFVHELTSGVWGVRWMREGDKSSRAAWANSHEEAVAILAEEASKYKLMGDDLATEDVEQALDAQLMEVAPQLDEEGPTLVEEKGDEQAVEPAGTAAQNAAARRAKARALGYDPYGRCAKCESTYSSASHLDNCEASTEGAIAPPISNGIEPADCTHHWKISTPEGEEASATCRKCLAARTFKNGELVKLPSHS